MKWTKEKVLEEALNYTTRSEFTSKASGAVKAAYRLNCYEEACSHFETAYKWTEALIRKTAKEYSTHTALAKGAPGLYKAAKRLGIFKEVSSHMPSSPTPLTKDDILDIASRYTTQKDFRLLEPRACKVAQNLGILKEVYTHMQLTVYKYTEEELLKEALKYSTRTALKSGSPSTYSQIYKSNLQSVAFTHMLPHYNVFDIESDMQGVYVLLKNNNVVYIGKSFAGIRKRIASHNNTKDFDTVHIYTFNTAGDTHIVELYLISKLLPKYNKDSADKCSSTLVLPNIAKLIKTSSTHKFNAPSTSIPSVTVDNYA